jgi:SAM-dependent methyltransferase
MGKKLNLVTFLHQSTKRNYIERMMNEKIICMEKARKYEFDYWDGDRKFGYGGYKYIKDRWKPFAESLIKIYKLDNKSKVLDAGCGKGYVLYELKRILPGLTISGFDISNHGLKNSKEEIKAYLFKHDIKEKFPFKKDEFDLVISLACLHNLQIQELEKSIAEIDRVGKKSYIMVEGYRNNEELFNLQCWALTAETFFHDKEWEWLFKKCNYSGDYELIYFE